MPPNEKGGPGTTRNPPTHENSASTNATNIPKVAEGSPRRYRTAYVSLYAPSARRTRWWACYICPFCKLGHFARLRSEADASGVRRSGCGRMVTLVVARTYRRKPKAAA